MVKNSYLPGMPPAEACDVFFDFVNDSIESHKKQIKEYERLGLETAVIETQAELRAYESCRDALNHYLNGAAYSD